MKKWKSIKMMIMHVCACISLNKSTLIVILTDHLFLYFQIYTIASRYFAITTTDAKPASIAKYKFSVKMGVISNRKHIFDTDMNVVTSWRFVMGRFRNGKLPFVNNYIDILMRPDSLPQELFQSHKYDRLCKLSQRMQRDNLIIFYADRSRGLLLPCYVE